MSKKHIKFAIHSKKQCLTKVKFIFEFFLKKLAG